MEGNETKENIKIRIESESNNPYHKDCVNRHLWSEGYRYASITSSEEVEKLKGEIDTLVLEKSGLQCVVSAYESHIKELEQDLDIMNLNYANLDETNTKNFNRVQELESTPNVGDEEIERQWLDCLNNPESEELPKVIKKYGFSEEIINQVLKPVFIGSAKWMRSEIKSCLSSKVGGDAVEFFEWIFTHCFKEEKGDSYYFKIGSEHYPTDHRTFNVEELYKIFKVGKEGGNNG